MNYQGKSDRSVFAAFTVGSLLVAALIVVGLLWTSINNHSENRRSECGAQVHSPEYEIQGGFWTGIRTMITVKCAVDEAIATPDTKYDEKDINAQEDMALWAFGALLFTALTFIATVAGVFYVRDTLFVSREIGQAQIRAYLEVPRFDDDDVSFSGLRVGERLTINTYVKNTGQTPARNVRWLATVGVFKHPYGGTEDMVVAKPGQTIPTRTQFHNQRSVTSFISEKVNGIEILKALSGEGVRIYCFGIIEYEDVFGASHRTRFCDYFEPVNVNINGAGVVSEGEWRRTTYHNDAT